MKTAAEYYRQLTEHTATCKDCLTNQATQHYPTYLCAQASSLRALYFSALIIDHAQAVAQIIEGASRVNTR